MGRRGQKEGGKRQLLAKRTRKKKSIQNKRGRRNSKESEGEIGKGRRKINKSAFSHQPNQNSRVHIHIQIVAISHTILNIVLTSCHPAFQINQVLSAQIILDTPPNRKRERGREGRGRERERKKAGKHYVFVLHSETRRKTMVTILKMKRQNNTTCSEALKIWKTKRKEQKQ